MNLYIPLATGQLIDQDVIDSILNQTISINIVICDSPGEINSEHNYTSLRIQSELKNRNDAINKFLNETNDKYFFMQSRDVIQLKPDNFENTINFMNLNPNYGACALPCKGFKLNHIVIATICITRELLNKGFRFANRYGRCPCKEMMEDISKLGYKYGYLGNELLVLNGKGN
jgi:hypothetical protein